MPADLHPFAQALARARRSARAIAEIPPEWAPADVHAAYALQHQAAAGQAIAGWKVSALAAPQQQTMGVGQPVSAPLLAAWTRSRFDAADFIAPLLECEIAFELGADLPPPATPYTRAAVAAAIRAVRVAIEVVDSRLPRGSGTLLQLADAFNNGGFWYGEPLADWQGLDFGRCRASLALHTGPASALLGAPASPPPLVAEGSGRAVLDGDLLGAVVAMANAQCPLYGGLRAGQIVTTGTCTGAVPLGAATRVEARIEGMGVAALEFTQGRHTAPGRIA